MKGENPNLNFYNGKNPNLNLRINNFKKSKF